MTAEPPSVSGRTRTVAGALTAALILALAGSAALSPGTAGAAVPLKLTRPFGASLMRKALHRRFGNTFDHGYARRVHCPTRVARGRVRCRISWVIGDISFKGRGAIWITYNRRGVAFWNFSYRVVRLDEYCASVGTHRHCRRVFVVK